VVRAGPHPPRAFTFGLLGVVLGISACSTPPAISPADQVPPATTPVPRGERTLSIDVNEPSDGNYDAAFRLAREAGAQSISLSIPWDSFEVAPGQFSPDPDYLSIANAYYPGYDASLALTLAPIDTNQLRVPQDLAALSFDDPHMIERFNRALELALARLSETEVSVLAIGNEIDVYLQGDPVRCADYASFLAATSAHARSLRPGLKVGTKATTGGLLGESRDCLGAINQSSDVILATYYPLGPDFSVRSPSSPAEDFAALADLAGAKPVYLLEVGYPSSERLGSSEAQQAEFVRQVFRAWDAQAASIPYVSFTWMHDIPDDALQGYLVYYGLDSAAFADFLGTLGLRSRDGRDKPAFLALAQEAAARGW
jgi:hypothetical protein